MLSVAGVLSRLKRRQSDNPSRHGFNTFVLIIFFQVLLDELKAQIERPMRNFRQSTFCLAFVKIMQQEWQSLQKLSVNLVAKAILPREFLLASKACSMLKLVRRISVLTEPKWFEGTLSDMRDVRREVAAMEGRLAILRKDFLIDEYQVYEARVYWAHTVLLIVTV